MANNVFANGREISCKKADGTSPAAFPDVCMTPPVSGFTPMGIPVPYFNLGKSSDTTEGSRSVNISGKEIIKKNKSFYKTSYGDEAGCATAAKKGFITGTIQGEVFFKSWSPNVKCEGENVVRHFDVTTHNHACDPGNESVPWLYIDGMAMNKIGVCKATKEDIEEKCTPKSKAKCPNTSKYIEAKEKCKAEFNRLWNKNLDLAVDSLEWALKKKKGRRYQAARKEKNKEIEKYSKKVQKNDCLAALRCNIVPKKKNGKTPCCPPQTPHHIVPASQFRNPDVEGYSYDDAPCICVEGQTQYQATHGKIHSRTAVATNEYWPPADQPFSGEERWTAGEAEAVGAQAVEDEFGCDKECIEAQVRKMHLAMGVKKNDKIKPTAPGHSKLPAKPSRRKK